MAIDNSSIWQRPPSSSYLGLDITEADADADTFVLNFEDGTSDVIGQGGGGSSPLSEANRTFTASGTTGSISSGFRTLDGVGYGFSTAWWEWAVQDVDSATPNGFFIHGRNLVTNDTDVRGIFNWINEAPSATYNNIYIQTFTTANMLRIIVGNNNAYKGWNIGSGDAGRVSVSDLASEEFYMCLYTDGTDMFWGLKKGSTAPTNLSDCDYSINSADNLNTIPDWDYGSYGAPSANSGIGANNGSFSACKMDIKMFGHTVGKVLLDPS
jgi:hypothetical protein